MQLDPSQYLPIAVTAVALITWFIRLESGVKANKERITDLEQKEHDLQPILRQIALDIASIKADLNWIKGLNNNNNNQQVNNN